MKKYLKPLLILTLLIIILTGCGTAEDYLAHETSAAYDEPTRQTQTHTTITPQQAQEKITQGGIIILDVRNQDEFDEGYIPNAILLPLGNLAELAPSVLTDKTLPILVYCRSGSRSLTAARILVDMGYEAVYNMAGGILAWDGQIARIFLVQQAIYADAEEFTFALTVHSPGEWHRYSVQSITVKDAQGRLVQEIAGLSTSNREAYAGNMFRLNFVDFNFDGFMDMALLRWDGGSAGNRPSYFWLWDSDLSQFIRNDFLEELSDFTHVWADVETGRVKTHSQSGTWPSHWWQRVYEYAGIGEFRPIYSIEYEIVAPENWDTGRASIRRTELNKITGEEIVSYEYIEN